MSIVIQNLEFPTKKALENKLRDILWATKMHESVTPDQQSFLIAVLQNHPDWQAKILGVEPKAIKVGLPPQSYHRCFYIVRHDGSEIDISFHKAVNAIPAAKKKTKAERAAEFVKGVNT